MPHWLLPDTYMPYCCAAQRRGVFLTSRSRPLTPADLSQFDYIIGMDAKNKRDILVAANYWIGSGSCSNEHTGASPDLEEVSGCKQLVLHAS